MGCASHTTVRTGRVYGGSLNLRNRITVIGKHRFVPSPSESGQCNSRPQYGALSYSPGAPSRGRLAIRLFWFCYKHTLCLCPSLAGLGSFACVRVSSRLRAPVMLDTHPFLFTPALNSSYQVFVSLLYELSRSFRNQS
ncbi:hypothetical protein C7460_104316 [Marinoscillum furvescens DSM 4134]|uniref:Uncharacterized protein n=1 Tax=Marinoscillum furvescens DSM 4134 TaxID=1122208 RepID=A0A3D9L6H7_MARFU|nr:hypothetical protein C7460_104316 [Marinoscillum furvescens DSM 4134]